MNLFRIALPERRILEPVAEHFLEPLIWFVPEELPTIARRFNARCATELSYVPKGRPMRASRFSRPFGTR